MPNNNQPQSTFSFLSKYLLNGQSIFTPNNPERFAQIALKFDNVECICTPTSGNSCICTCNYFVQPIGQFIEIKFSISLTRRDDDLVNVAIFSKTLGSLTTTAIIGSTFEGLRSLSFANETTLNINPILANSGNTRTSGPIGATEPRPPEPVPTGVAGAVGITTTSCSLYA